MEMVDSEPDDEEARAWYQADVHRLAESSEMIAWSFEALVLLLAERLPMPMSGIQGREVQMRREWKMRKKDMYQSNIGKGRKIIRLIVSF